MPKIGPQAISVTVLQQVMKSVIKQEVTGIVKKEVKAAEKRLDVKAEQRNQGLWFTRLTFLAESQKVCRVKIQTQFA